MRWCIIQIISKNKLITGKQQMGKWALWIPKGFTSITFIFILNINGHIIYYGNPLVDSQYLNILKSKQLRSVKIIRLIWIDQSWSRVTLPVYMMTAGDSILCWFAHCLIVSDKLLFPNIIIYSVGKLGK